MAIADDPTGAQQAHTLQLQLQGPPPPTAPQPVVVDRVAYLQQQEQQRRQAAAEAEQSVALLRQAEAANFAMQPKWEVAPSPFPDAQSAAFAREVAQMNMTPEEFNTYSKFRANLPQQGQEILSRTAVLPSPGDRGQLGGRGYFNPSAGQIVGVGVLQHELAHVYDAELSPQQKTRFMQTVMALARGGDNTAQYALQSAPDDPQHVYTYFVDVGVIPPALRPFYEGVLQKREPGGYRGTQWEEDDPRWQPIFARERMQDVRQQREEQPQNAALMRRIQAIQSPEFQQGINQLFQQGTDIALAGAGQQSALAVARKHAREFGILDSDNPRAKYLRQLLDTDPEQYLTAVGEPGLIPGQAPGVGIGGAAANIHRAAKQQIPGMETVQQAVGEGARAVVMPDPWELVGLPGTSGIRRNAAEQIAQAFVPTNWYGFAVELFPGVGAIPGAQSAISRVLKEGGYDLTVAGVRKFLAAEGTQGALKKILAATGSESGALRIARQAEDIGGPTGKEVLPQVRQQLKPTGSKIAVGTRVFASDRNNFGRVVSVSGDTAKVYFRSPSGGEATIDLPLETLNPIISGGRKVGSKVVPLSADELAQAWEVLPVENQRLVGTIATHTMTDQERNALIAASRSRKAGDIAGIFSGPGTADEKLAKAWASRQGADAPEQVPLREFFDDSDIASYKQQVVDAANNGLVTPHEATNAGALIDLLMDGRRPDGTRRLISAGERALMGKIFGPELMKVLPTTPQKMSLLQKFLAPLHLWRSAKTAFDLGAMFRQGRRVIFSDPVEWARASRAQFRALGQQGYDRVMEAVRNSRHYALGQSAERPLGIIEQSSGLADEFLSPLTKKIPGLDASERIYNAFVNVLRQAIFDKNMDQLIREFGDISRVPMSEVQRIIDNINTATMFGNVSKLGDWGKVLSQTLFSARGLVSHPQFYADFIRAMGPNASPAARKIIATRTASAIASDLAILGGVAYLGALLKEQGSPTSVEVDLKPFSQTLGDVRIGPIKWNPWGAEATFVRAAIQAAWGKKQREGELAPTDINPFERVKGFGRTKLSPIATVVYDLFLNEQKDFRGRPIKDRTWEYAVEQASPIMGWALYEAFQEKGFWGAAELGQGVGLDVQVYGPSERSSAVGKLQQAGIKVLREDGKTVLRPPVLESDFKSRDWRDEFAKDFSELGDLSRFAYVNGMKDAYVDYWLNENGPGELGERQTRLDYGRAFEQHDSIKLWRKNEKLELWKIWQADPDLFKIAVAAGFEDASQEEREQILSP